MNTFLQVVNLPLIQIYPFAYRLKLAREALADTARREWENLKARRLRNARY